MKNIDLANAIVLEVKEDNDFDIAIKYAYVAEQKYPKLYEEFALLNIRDELVQKKAASFLEKLVLELLKNN